jgi:XRE family transcriptional regulator, aerobic/anaerobic benzoate catabolism transcriptional regulator
MKRKATAKLSLTKPRGGAPLSDKAYLGGLGDRVRQMRARRGMTRKILARDSGVSERYLAQLESGEGNISILLLRRIAAAMGLPLGDLLQEGPERPVEYTLARQLLDGLAPAELGAAYQALARSIGRNGDTARAGRIALIGLRGAGKTTLGHRLAERLGVPFVEMAAAIAEESGTSLSEIFSLYGQAAYRRYEKRALERAIGQHDRAVIATGGSLVSEPATFDLLLRSCHTVWVAASPAEHMGRVMAQGDLRPMQASREAMADLKRILENRRALYGKADAVVDTTGRAIDESADALFEAAQRLLGATDA